MPSQGRVTNQPSRTHKNETVACGRESPFLAQAQQRDLPQQYLPAARSPGSGSIARRWESPSARPQKNSSRPPPLFLALEYQVARNVDAGPDRGSHQDTAYKKNRTGHHQARHERRISHVSAVTRSLFRVSPDYSQRRKQPWRPASRAKLEHEHVRGKIMLKVVPMSSM
jgi:hypothetical protein